MNKIRTAFLIFPIITTLLIFLNYDVFSTDSPALFAFGLLSIIISLYILFSLLKEATLLKKKKQSKKFY
ncbi:hypothetical protein L1275_000113 [Flavobacterium sp. HSC-61S13]|nr:hypothetical protein [Flavobacterium sp. HSC-61S13]